MTTNHTDLIHRLRTRPTGDPYLHALVHEAADALEAMQPSVREPLTAAQIWHSREIMSLNGQRMGLRMEVLMEFARLIEKYHGITAPGAQHGDA